MLFWPALGRGKETRCESITYIFMQVHNRKNEGRLESDRVKLPGGAVWFVLYSASALLLDVDTRLGAPRVTVLN